MMKKLKKVVTIVLILGFIFLPNAESAKASGETLGYYEEKLNQFKAEAAANTAAINKTQSEINEANNRIAALRAESDALILEVQKLTEEIEINQESIRDKLFESKQILEYLEVSSGKNVYLDYVFKADSITDLINRDYIIKEIVDYNDKVIDSLEQIIKDNEARQVEIDERQVKIEETERELEAIIVSLGEQKASLSAGGSNIQDQINNMSKIVKMYRDLGCKSNDVIGVDCATQSGNSYFRRPTQTGYITQENYYTNSSKSHRAVDIGSRNGQGEKIYPVADGTITSIYKDNYGALCIVIEHYYLPDDQYYSSLYVHLSSYAPGLYVGKKVTSDQYIGYMGNTGYSFGTHLHLELYPCRLYNPADRNCSRWSSYDSFAKGMIRSGYNIRDMISFPSGTYNPWYSR